MQAQLRSLDAAFAGSVRFPVARRPHGAGRPPLASDSVAVHTADLQLATQGDTDVIDITAEVQTVVAQGAIDDGVLTAFVRGSTAAITTMEFEPGGVADLRTLLDRL